MRLEQYVKRAMQEYCSIFPTRFSVLEHLFAVNGNGVRLNADGFIDGAQYTLLSDSEIKEKVNEEYGWLISSTENMISALDEVEHSLTIEQFRNKVEQQKIRRDEKYKSLVDIDNTYNKEIDLSTVTIYGWGSYRRFIPMYVFEECKYDDIVEQLEYFRDVIASAPYGELEKVEDERVFNQHNYRVNAMRGWKENLSEVDAVIEKIKARV